MYLKCEQGIYNLDKVITISHTFMTDFNGVKHILLEFFFEEGKKLELIGEVNKPPVFEVFAGAKVAEAGPSGYGGRVPYDPAWEMRKQLLSYFEEEKINVR